MIIKKIFLFLLVVVSLYGCNSKSREVKRTCIDFNILKEGKLVKVDSCFTASTTDSLEIILANVHKQQQEQTESFETRMLIIFVDTLQKEPKDYEYAICLSEAGIINGDVILTTDPSIVQEKCRPYSKGNIIIRKLRVGENTHGMVEDFFKHNVRINYRRVSNQKIDS
jgi:hypothetical protein